jgi:cytochrome b involved in lipid metabolism
MVNIFMVNINVYYKVYDVSPYVEQHMGGDAILKNAGLDSSAGFHGGILFFKFFFLFHYSL